MGVDTVSWGDGTVKHFDGVGGDMGLNCTELHTQTHTHK